MENYLVLNGQKIELTPEQYKEVCNVVSPKENTPFSKEEDRIYYYIGDDGLVSITTDQRLFIDGLRYENANYCSNRDLMVKRANYEALERVLWRFSEENGGAGLYSIYYSKKVGGWGTAKADILMFGPTFCSKNIALRAIEVAKEWLSDNGLTPEKVFF